MQPYSQGSWIGQALVWREGQGAAALSETTSPAHPYVT